MAFKAAGTTVSFGGTPIGKVENARIRIGGDDLDITAHDDSRATFEPGMDEIEVELDIVGAGLATLERGDTGDVVITPADSSGARTFSDMFVSSLSIDAPKRGYLSGTVVFKAGESA